MAIREQLVGFSFLPYGSQGLDSGHYVWWQIPLSLNRLPNPGLRILTFLLFVGTVQRERDCTHIYSDAISFYKYTISVLFGFAILI